jgi:hypothetical protein
MAKEISNRTKQNGLFARNSKLVARLTERETKTGSLPEDDPLLNLDKFEFEGPGGVLTNREID